MDTLKAIIEHGIAVRQIPTLVIGKWSKGYTTSCKRSTCTTIVENGREFVRVERVPENAGYWIA